MYKRYAAHSAVCFAFMIKLYSLERGDRSHNDEKSRDRNQKENLSSHWRSNDCWEWCTATEQQLNKNKENIAAVQVASDIIITVQYKSDTSVI